jgi:parallel beta-helix repeat protein
MGGVNSGDIVLLRNRIRDSRAEGLFLMDSGYCQIHANEITGSNDGIVMVDSSPLLLANDVCENQRAGVLCSGLSFPRIERNLIAHNLVAGVLFRDEAIAACENNKVKKIIRF